MNWALAEQAHQIQTIWFLRHKAHNQPLFILRHILATAKKE